MARFDLILALCCLLNCTVMAQVADTTTYLQEVGVYGLPVTLYATGSKVQRIKSGDAVATLSDQLLSRTSLYFKTYGNNQLSTVALRGTTASQTAVLWNGININSPTLGQTDFALIPVFLTDEVSLQYGTGSALYGSDAIGGSILIGQSAAQFKKGYTGTFYQQIGSFGRRSTGLKASFGNSRWEFRTKLYHSFIANDFPYNARAVGHSKIQNHAAVTNYGFDQQAHFKISETQQISAEGMYTNNFREIQPAVTVDNANETLADRHVRLSLKYQNDSRFGIFSATSGYIFSDQDFMDDNISTVRSSQLTTLLSMDKTLNAKTSVRYGVNYSHYDASSANFISKVSENRYDGFLSFRYAIYRYWFINLNLRQSIYDNKYAPLAPTLGTEVHLLHSEKSTLVVRSQVARGFRVPTLNDRYYIPGGNPNVNPEDAMHVEGGFTWSSISDPWSYTLDGSVYRSWIDNMIVWQNEDGIWSPTNLQKVNLHGIEINADASYAASNYRFSGALIYAYTRSINQEGQNSFVDKQLAYVPVHTGRASVSIMWRHWLYDVNLNVTGIRYTTLDNARAQALDPYGLVDTSLSKDVNMKHFRFRVKAEAFNIFNAYYENLKNHAMPGRNFAISISINFNNQHP